MFRCIDIKIFELIVCKRSEYFYKRYFNHVEKYTNHAHFFSTYHFIVPHYNKKSNPFVSELRILFDRSGGIQPPAEQARQQFTPGLLDLSVYR